MTRWSEADLAKYQSTVKQQLQAVPKMDRRKYGNTKTLWQGQKFDSRLEMRRYQELVLQQQAGAIRAVIRQVSLPMPNSTVRMRVDFMIVENDGRIRWLDAKGFATEAWRNKQKQVFEAYGIKVETI